MKRSCLSALGQRTQEPPISWLMKMALDRPKLISLAAGFTDNTSLPVDESRVLLNEILRSRKSGERALQYGTTAGDRNLRKVTAEYLQTQDLCEYKPVLDEPYNSDRMLITHGSQQLLYMVTEALCDEGDIVLVEEPTYFVFLGIVQSRGLRARGVRLTKHGIDLGHLEQVLKELQEAGEIERLKFLYLVSYYQNPTGITTRLEHKSGALQLLRKFEIAAGHPIYLLEDAAYRELRFSSGEVPSSLATGELASRVIYMGTYSKPFATGVRVGFGILPEPLFEVVRRIKGNHDFGTSSLLQELLVEALGSGVYQKHLLPLRMRYALKANVMMAALKTYCPPELKWDKPRGGLYIWAKMPLGIETGVESAVFKAALARDVLYVPGELCYADDPTRPKPNHEMRLSFGGATELDIGRGIKRLGAVLGEFTA